jgi:hypothetical protein
LPSTALMDPTASMALAAAATASALLVEPTGLPARALVRALARLCTLHTPAFQRLLLVAATIGLPWVRRGLLSLLCAAIAGRGSSRCAKGRWLKRL